MAATFDGRQLMLKPAADKASLVVCSTCRFPDGRKQDAQGRSGGEVLAQQLAVALGDHPCRGALGLQTMPCLFACNAACNVHLRSHGRMGYILGKFEPIRESAIALLDYAAHYLATADGVVPYARWPDGVKSHFLVRIPPEGAVWNPSREQGDMK